MHIILYGINYAYTYYVRYAQVVITNIIKTQARVNKTVRIVTENCC